MGSTYKNKIGVNYGLCYVFLAIVIRGQGQIIWNSEPLEFFLVDVFTEVEDENASLAEKIIFVESRVCSGQCADRYPEEELPRETRFKPACAPCFCDRWCVVFQDCCPDLVLRHTVTYQGPKPGCHEMIPSGMDPERVGILDALALIDRCPEGQTELDESLRASCEEPDMTRMEDALPVSVHSLSYRNIYCARCHHNRSVAVQPWEAEIKCNPTAQQLMENTTTKRQVFETLLTPEGARRTSCNMRFTLSHRYDRKCRLAEEPLESSCRAAGFGGHPREEMVQACAAYTSVFMAKYKNMFCYMCSQEYPSSLGSLQSRVGVPPQANQARTNFRALLDFGDVYSNEVEGEFEEVEGVEVFVCEEPEFYDSLRCECRRPECSQLKYLTSTGNCEPMANYGNNLGYRACAQVNITTGSAILQEDMNKLSGNLYSLSSGDVIKIVVKTSRWCPGDPFISFQVEAFVWHHGDVKAAEKQAEEFSLHLRAIFEWGWDVTEFTYVLSGECGLNVEPTFPCLFAPSFEQKTTTTRANLVARPDPMDTVYFVEYTDFTKCPWIDFTRGDLLNILQNGSLEFNSTELENITGRFESNETNQIKMCLSEYERLFTNRSRDRCEKEGKGGRRRKKTDEFDRWTPEGLVSIISSCISLLFLFLTFLVYLLLPSVRAGGGKNIMALTLVLFTAQALYEFAIEQYENATACKIIGVLIHFSWLASVFSMNACTVERFYKLSFPLKSRSFFMSNKPFLVSVAYFLSCSLLIVGVNITLNLLFRDDFGYGGNSLCYINSAQSRVYAFALPMGVVVLVNILLLVLTVCNLKRASHSEILRGSTSERSKLGLVACVRLSGVTGLMWLVAFLYEVVPSDVLAYIFTALIGLQGVLFFFSLVVNKRVLGLLRDFAHASVSAHGRTSSSGQTYETSSSSGRRMMEQKGNKQGQVGKTSERDEIHAGAEEKLANKGKSGIFSSL